jgi:hypothetical protein
MRLNPVAFNAFLSGNIGQNMNWRKGNLCPCFNPQSGAAIPGHPLCAGKGWIWDAPIAAKAGVNSSPKEKREWAQMGQWEAGDVVMTVPSDSTIYNKLGRFDRIELLNAQDVFKLMLTRGVNDRIILPVINFTRVFWLDPTNINNTIDGGLPAIDGSGNLTWPNNDGPPAKTQYSIAGTRFIDFFVWYDLPSSRNEHFGAALPQKAWLRRLDLFGR